MKTLLLIISLTIFIPSARDSLFAQWVVAHSDTNRHFNSIFFTNPNTGYVSGGNFTGGLFPLIRKTTNAGSSWVEQTSPQRDSTGFVYPDVFFTDMNTGYIAVTYFTNINHGRILKTTNGGTNWSIVQVGKAIWSIYFINSSTGYAAGYQTLLKTTDAGATWVDKHFPNFLRDIHFTDINTGYVAGEHGYILKTTNGGTDWDKQKPTNIHLYGLSFADANTGIAVGGWYNDTKNIILRTTNAGLNWIQIPYNYSTCNLISVRFINPATGWIAGRCSQIIKTTDGGASWFNQTSPVGDNIYFSDIFFTSALRGYIGGRDLGSTNGVGYILKTTNGGDEYSPVGKESISNEVPEVFRLEQNYPNPFNPTTNIKYSVPENGFVKLSIYNLVGEEVNVLINKQIDAGFYEVTFNAANIPSGVYFYQLNAGNFVETKKMILMK